MTVCSRRGIFKITTSYLNGSVPFYLSGGGGGASLENVKTFLQKTKGRGAVHVDVQCSGPFRPTDIPSNMGLLQRKANSAAQTCRPTWSSVSLRREGKEVLMTDLGRFPLKVCQPLRVGYLGSPYQTNLDLIREMRDRNHFFFAFAKKKFLKFSPRSTLPRCRQKDKPGDAKEKRGKHRFCPRPDVSRERRRPLKFSPERFLRHPSDGWAAKMRDWNHLSTSSRREVSAKK